MIKNKSERKVDEITLNEIFRIIWSRKLFITLFTLLCTSGSLFYSLNQPDIFKSEVALVAAEDSSIDVPGQLGGLAALAGVNIGSMNSGNKTNLAIEILKSRDFIGRFIEKNDLYIPIMAASGWNRSDNTLIINSDIYDVISKKWIRDVSPPFEPKPSKLETIEEFKKIFSITKDKNTGVETLSIEHYSPFLAKEWLDLLVKSINEEMRNRDLKEAKLSISYLQTKINETNVSDIRTMLFALIEEQTKTLMLANVRTEYVLKTVDPAVVAEKKFKPHRFITVMVGFLAGLTISIFLVLIMIFTKND